MLKILKESKITNAPGILEIVFFILGAFAVLALPPFGYYVLFAFSLSLCLLIFDKTQGSLRPSFQDFKLGTIFGFGYFFFSLYWVKNSLNFAPDLEYLSFFILFFLPLANGLFIGLVFYIYKFIIFYLSLKRRWQKLIIFAQSWMFVEMIKEKAVDFPWNLAGYMLYDSAFVQISSVFGIYGLTLISIAMSASLFVFLEFKKEKKAIFSMVSIFAILFIWGKILEKEEFESSGVKVAVIQANIKQDLKWDGLKILDNVLKHVKMSNESGADIVIWPEAAVAANIENPQVKEVLKELKAKFLITGAIRLSTLDRKMWNSAFFLKNQEILNFYDKRVLVPFGEYVPFRKIIPIKKITHGTIDYESGDSRKEFNLENGLSFVPTICFESIFPELHSSESNSILLNLTNDSWFGNSIGPKQHFHHFRIRAIEQGSFAIRASNSGISALISPKGDVIRSTQLLVEDVLIFDLSIGIDSLTIYNQYGTKPLLFVTVLLFVFCIYINLRCVL